MKKAELPVIAAIPAFNEEQELRGLLDQVLEQKYDDIFVLDDASTDHTVELALSYGDNIQLIAGGENIGSAGNRNRIIPALGQDAIIHFIDADTRLNISDGPEAARHVIERKDVGYVGGLINNKDGDQLVWNFGPAFSIPQMLSAGLQSKLDRISRENAAKAARFRSIAEKWSLMRQWPDTLAQPVPRQVYWAAEANTVVKSAVFQAVGGYNPTLRYHEAMDLSLRMEPLGLKRYFDPSISVTHLDNGYKDKSKTANFWSAYAKIIREMGLRNFVFTPEFDELDSAEN